MSDSLVGLTAPSDRRERPKGDGGTAGRSLVSEAPCQGETVLGGRLFWLYL